METLNGNFFIRRLQPMEPDSLWFQAWQSPVGWVWLAGERRWVSERTFSFLRLPQTSLFLEALSGEGGLQVVTETQACAEFPTAFDAVQPWVPPLRAAAVNY
jgi:hypothetical protein